MLAVRVQGGTGAGCRKPPVGRHHDWTCQECLRFNRGFMRRCVTPGCNAKR